MQAPNGIDIVVSRKLEAVVIPYGDGFMAVGIQIAAWGFGEEIEDALIALAEQCGDVLESCAEDLGTDLAFVYGVNNLAFRFLADTAIEEREMPLEMVGHG